MTLLQNCAKHSPVLCHNRCVIMAYLLSFRTILIALGILGGSLAASVVLTDTPQASIYLVPDTSFVEVGDKVTIAVMVQSNMSVNAFTSELVFDPEFFQVTSISYNTSIANLWVEEPWYNRANNSVYFAGGTTITDGFIGTGELLRTTLHAKKAGNTAVILRNTRVLAHDGLGRDVSLKTPLDTLFSIDTTPFAAPLEETGVSTIAVISDVPPLDANDDGVVDFKDIGTLLTALGSKKDKYDYNRDGTVNWSDVRTWQQLRKTSE